jgi:hypothetical protein
VTCEQKVEAELIFLGFAPQELKELDLLAYIRFACLNGAPPKWIASHIYKLKNLKALMQALQTKYPELSDDDLEKLSRKYLNGASVNKINDAANDIVKAKPKKKKKSGPKD